MDRKRHKFHLLKIVFSDLNRRYHDVLKSMFGFMKKKILNIKDRDENSPLDLAIVSGSPEVVKILMDNGAEI